MGLGFVNEYRSELAVAALHANIRHETVVSATAHHERLDVRELVPGDVVSLSVGDLVPADVRLIEASQLECDEGVLTGESMSAAKSVAPTSSDSAVDLPSCAFMGTVVHQGSAEAVVVATGPATAFGKIAVGLSERPAETAFQVGPARLLRAAGAGRGRAHDLDLRDQRRASPARCSRRCCSRWPSPSGSRRSCCRPSSASACRPAPEQLARRHVLVKRLVTIEDLGNIEVLFTDKTGTLTEGAITFDQALDPDGQPAHGAAAARPGLQRSDDDRRRPGRRQRSRRCTVVRCRRRVVSATPARRGAGAIERLGLLPFDHDRQLASVARAHARGRHAPRHQRCARGGAGPLPRRSGPKPRGTLERLFADGARVVAVATRRAPEPSQPTAGR